MKSVILYNYICESCHAFHYKYPYAHIHQKVTTCENCGAQNVNCFMCSCPQKFVQTLKGLRYDNGAFPLPKGIELEVCCESKGKVEDPISQIWLYKIIHDVYYQVNDCYPGKDLMETEVVKPLKSFNTKQLKSILQHIHFIIIQKINWRILQS